MKGNCVDIGMSHIPSANIVKFHSKLNEFREAGKYVDIDIKCEDRTFKCHRLALTMASDYFDAMFTGSFKECSAPMIELNETSAETFEQVISFLYTGDAVINADSVYDLLRASDFFGLPGMEVLCIEYVKNMSTSVKNILNLLEFAHATKKNELKKITILQISEHFDLFSKTDLFLEVMTYEDLHRILSQQYDSLMSVRNEERLLSAVIRWVHYQYAERSQHFDEFFKLINLENISQPYVRLLVDKIAASNQEIVKSVDNTEIAKLQHVTLRPRKFLHVYVGYEDEELTRIFSINDVGDCTISGETSISRGSHGFRNVTLDNSYLYRLSYYYGNVNDISSDYQTFSAFTAVNRNRGMSLTLPPVVFRLPHLCNVQNNIYVYNARPFSCRTKSPNSELFTEEELNRCIYVYNCDLDKWFPVPAAKQLFQYSCMTVHNNIVYLIGGEGATGFVQAYDFRTEKWQEMPRTVAEFDAAGCCTLNGKIYVCGGYASEEACERYDPVAGKWEKRACLNTEALHPLVTPYKDKIWVMNTYSNISCEEGEEAISDMSVEIYDPALDQWSTSSIIVEAVEKTINPTTIMDCIVFG